MESFKISRRLSLLTLIFTTLITLPPCFTEAMGTRPKAPPPNLLLITIDTLRADHLGCYGYQDIHTPCIDTLASEGILFTQALTPVPITLPSHVSIMTGLYPMQHGICNNANSVLGEEATTLAEIMEKEGYKTAAFVGAFVLHSMFGLNQGFQAYNNSPSKKKRSGASPFDNERRAEEVTRSALQWLESNHDSPFFLWVHYFDPHAMYLPPSPFKEEYKGHLYDGEIAYTDSCLGPLLDGLKKLGVSDKTVIILTSDHGEGLGEHGESTHAVFLYDSTLHIPLILKIPPGVIPRLQNMKPEITSMVSLLDIFPTIMDLFSLRPDQIDLNQWPGKSLIPLIEGSCQIHQEEIFCETLYPELNFGWSRVEGIRTHDWKYVKSPRSELYHLSEDPNETVNLLSNQSLRAQGWEERLIRLKKNLEREKRQPQVITDSDVLQRLESLGYFRSVMKDTSAGDDISQRSDPKDMIHLIESIDRGLSYYYLGSYDLAYDEFHKILEVNPDNISATFYLGSVEEKMGRFEQARDRFLHLLSMEPNYLDAHNHLGVIYHHLGQGEEAIKEFQLALKKAEYPDV
ncbi:MAG: sulfatase-like hydrolase/transferase, partial [bacterium]